MLFEPIDFAKSDYYVKSESDDERPDDDEGWTAMDTIEEESTQDDSKVETPEESKTEASEMTEEAKNEEFEVVETPEMSREESEKPSGWVLLPSRETEKYVPCPYIFDDQSVYLEPREIKDGIKSGSVQSCLYQFTKTEKIQDGSDPVYFCENCQER